MGNVRGEGTEKYGNGPTKARGKERWWEMIFRKQARNQSQVPQEDGRGGNMDIQDNGEPAGDNEMREEGSLL